MNLAILLGNGFDIQLGLNTRYIDFYKWFLFQDDSGHIIDDMNGEFATSKHQGLVEMMHNQKSSNWSDLELLLGESLGLYFSSAQEISEEKAYLEQSINNYLKKEQKRFRLKRGYADELRECFDKQIMRMMEVCGWANDGPVSNVQFITFNYTNTIERMIDCINTSEAKNLLKYYMPQYIHGCIDKTVILGVDSEEQYYCPYSVGSIDEINNVMLKPKLNNAIRANAVNDIKETLKHSDKIIIFGSSIGETDKYWWQLIGKWLSRNSNHSVCLFTYIKNENIASATAQLIPPEYKERFISFFNPEIQKNIDIKQILTIKCQDWMFRFDDCIEIVSENAFSNMFVDEIVG